MRLPTERKLRPEDGRIPYIASKIANWSEAFRFSLVQTGLLGCVLSHTSPAESIRQGIIRLVARVLVHEAIDLGDGHFTRPWFGPHPGIFYSELIQNRIRVNA